MADDLSLLGGLGQGLMTGLKVYNDERDRQFRIKQYQDEQEVKGLLRKQEQEKINMSATHEGLMPIASTDPNQARTFDFTPEEKFKRTQEGLLKAAQIEEAKGKAAQARSYAEQGNNPLSRQEDRQAFQAHQKNIQALKKDKPLMDKLTQMNNLGAALNNLANADHITPQQFDEAQQAIRANLGIKGQSGIGERERTQLNSLGLDADRFGQFLSGSPASMDPSDPFIQHIKNLAALEQENIQNQVGSRISAVTGGNDWMYSDPKFKKYKDSLDSLIGSTKAQYQGGGGLIKSGLPKAGETHDGYRFKGGDPSDKNNWEKL